MKKNAPLLFLFEFLLVLNYAGAIHAAEIRGTVTDHAGDPFPDMPVRAVDAAGNEYRTFTGADGGYSLPGLAAGTYTLQVNPPCCSFNPYSRDAIELEQQASFTQDVSFGEALIVLGDDPGLIATELRNKQSFTDSPAPRKPDGTVDLSGVWLIGSDPYPPRGNAYPEAEAVAMERIRSSFKDHPHTRCLPSTPPAGGGTAPFMAKYVQTDDLLVILFEDVPGYRQIYLDGREHPERINPSWMGHSIGRWEGDTLVVDTIGFNDRGWTDAYPRSYRMHMIERYTRTSYGSMALEITFEDPEVFITPYVLNLPYSLAPQEDLLEYVCENNQWAE